jgi:hypothetical protein
MVLNQHLLSISKKNIPVEASARVITLNHVPRGTKQAKQAKMLGADNKPVGTTKRE